MFTHRSLSFALEHRSTLFCVGGNYERIWFGSDGGGGGGENDEGEDENPVSLIACEVNVDDSFSQNERFIGSE